MRQSLRGETHVEEATKLVGEDEARLISNAQHMPTFVGFRIAHLLKQLRSSGLDTFAFQSAELSRAQLIDAIGACERIRNTRMPLVLAIKTRRFILLFLTLLPFALAERLGLLTPLVAALAAYPLFSLDEIGAELQNPFSPRNLSHLPLDQICKNIERNVLAIETYDHDRFDIKPSQKSQPKLIAKDNLLYAPSIGAVEADTF
jgi:putative membrane protein